MENAILFFAQTSSKNCSRGKSSVVGHKTPFRSDGTNLLVIFQSECKCDGAYILRRFITNISLLTWHVLRLNSHLPSWTVLHNQLRWLNLMNIKPFSCSRKFKIFSKVSAMQMAPSLKGFSPMNYAENKKVLADVSLLICPNGEISLEAEFLLFAFCALFEVELGWHSVNGQISRTSQSTGRKLFSSHSKQMHGEKLSAQNRFQRQQTFGSFEEDRLWWWREE